MKLSVQDILTNKYFINEAVLSFSILNVVDVGNDECKGGYASKNQS